MQDKAGDAAHILIDAVVSFEPGRVVGSDSPMNIAVRRLNDVPGLITADYFARTVDVSPVVNGSIVSLYVLAVWLAAERGTSVELVMADLREQVDALS